MREFLEEYWIVVLTVLVLAMILLLMYAGVLPGIKGIVTMTANRITQQ